MASENYAGNIIAILAGLPEFLRKPILKKRMAEFSTLSAEERAQMISDALEAGPTLPFPTFAILFESWLQILAQMPAAERRIILEGYAAELAASPHKVVPLNVDGIQGIFRSLPPEQQGAIANVIRGIIRDMEPEAKRRILIIMPDSARAMMGL